MGFLSKLGAYRATLFALIIGFTLGWCVGCTPDRSDGYRDLSELTEGSGDRVIIVNGGQQASAFVPVPIFMPSFGGAWMYGSAYNGYRYNSDMYRSTGSYYSSPYASSTVSYSGPRTYQPRSSYTTRSGSVNTQRRTTAPTVNRSTTTTESSTLAPRRSVQPRTYNSNVRSAPIRTRTISPSRSTYRSSGYRRR